MLDTEQPKKPLLLHSPFHNICYPFEMAMLEVAKYQASQLAVGTFVVLAGALALLPVDAGFFDFLTVAVVSAIVYGLMKIPPIRDAYVRRVAERDFARYEDHLESLHFFHIDRHLPKTRVLFLSDMDLRDASSKMWHEFSMPCWTVGFDWRQRGDFLRRYKDLLKEKRLCGLVLINGDSAHIGFFKKELRGPYCDFDEVDKSLLQDAQAVVLNSLRKWYEEEDAKAEQETLTVGQIRSLIASAPDTAKIRIKGVGGARSAVLISADQSDQISDIELSV